MTAKDKLHLEWQAVVERAYLAGDHAARNAVPNAMIVGTPKDMMASLTGGDDGGFDPDEPTYFVAEGVCGFAWVTVRGRKFENWLQGKVATKFPAAPALNHVEGADWRGTSAVNPPRHDSYKGGTSVWVGGFGQSMQRKEAFAHAFARVVNEIEGVTAYPGSRMD